MKSTFQNFKKVHNSNIKQPKEFSIFKVLKKKLYELIHFSLKPTSSSSLALDSN